MQHAIELGPVTVWPGRAAGKYPDGNQVIVRGTDATAVFDTPLVAHDLPADAGLDGADLIILGHVHEDHMAALGRLQHVPIHVHRGDVEAARSWAGLAAHYGYPQTVLDDLHNKIVREFFYTPRPDAIGYEDGATWELGGVRVRAVHMPGHTRGHCVLLVEPHGIAFIGDIDLSTFGPYYGDATSSLGEFRRTLTRIAELPATCWITSHHKGVIRERSEFLALLRAFTARLDVREARLLELLGDGPRSLDDLARSRVVYRPEASELWIDSAERHSIAQHLDELLLQQRVRRDGDLFFVD
jgi:glyoxylase-like metal-dependent hydrolase (beta-lactamase superfamily II)